MDINYKDLKDIDILLCNPNLSELCTIIPSQANVTLRLNDLSDLSIEVPKYISGNNTKKKIQKCYDLIETKRLVYVAKIGWFEIVSVKETISNAGFVKSITAQSHQSILKNKGFYTENRVYRFYNPLDKFDDNYSTEDVSSIPSVCGQLNKQLGIKLDISDDEIFSQQDYKDWTLVYIDEDLKDENAFRTFEEKTTTGYDFLVNSVGNAYEVIVLFDLLHHTIKIKHIDSITIPTDIYLSFDNLIKTIDVTENASDIVTVLNCNGNNLDIRTVNPMGANYLVNFDYYKNRKWMSQGLIDCLNNWKVFYESNITNFSNYVATLQGQYKDMSNLENIITQEDLKIKYLNDARDEILKQSTIENPIISAEKVELGNKSLYENSSFYTTPFVKNNTTIFTCYENAPDLTNTDTSPNQNMSGTLDECANANFLYFYDDTIVASDKKTYCKLDLSTEIDSQNQQIIYASGFTRFTTISNSTEWIDLHEKYLAEIKNKKELYSNNIGKTLDSIKSITDVCNVRNYINNYDIEHKTEYLKELDYYWAEGDYTNDNFALLEDMTLADSINLAIQLKTAGETQIKKVSQPKFSFNISLLDILRIKRFKKFASQLQLGKTITVEKEDGVYYIPALTEMSFSILGNNDLTLTFSNSAKLNGNEFTFADLVAESSSVSKSVTSSWQDLMSYSHNKEKISNLIANPLDRALRAGMAGSSNQEFLVDDTGILGRRYSDTDHTSFLTNQIRIISNNILFTDDNWDSVKTALGQIHYTIKENGIDKDKTAYGLIAQTLIGSLMMTEKLNIINENSSIELNSNGITIKKDGTIVFTANTDGNVSITGRINATSGYIGDENNGFIIDSNSLSHSLTNEEKRVIISTGTTSNYKVYNSENTNQWMIIAGKNFGITNSGELFASKGNIAGMRLAYSSSTSNGVVGYINKLSADRFVIGTTSFSDSTPDYTFIKCWDSNHSEDMPNVRLDINGVLGEGGFFNSLETTNLTVSSCINAPVLKMGNMFISDNAIKFGTSETSVDSGIFFGGKYNGGNSKKYYTAQLSLFGGGNMLSNPMFRIQLYGANGDTLAADETINFTVYYCGIGGNQKSVTISIPQGTDANTASGDTVFWGLDYFSLDPNNHNVKTMLFSQGSNSNGDYVGVKGHLLPTTGNEYSLGLSLAPWQYVYANIVYGTFNNTSSDRRLKKDIKLIEDKFSNFYDRLKPSTYEFVNEIDKKGQLHFGLIAQEVELALKDSGLTQDCAVVQTPNETNSERYYLQYNEFIALNIYEIQKLKRKVSDLENKIKQYEGA